jgi:hypothetical protein
VYPALLVWRFILMANGLEMLMRSVGFDPDEIKEQMVQTQQKISEELTAFHQQLNRIEATQQQISNRLSTLEEKEVMQQHG